MKHEARLENGEIAVVVGLVVLAQQNHITKRGCDAFVSKRQTTPQSHNWPGAVKQHNPDAISHRLIVKKS